MLKSQENKFTMAKAIDNYLNENEAIVSATPELLSHYNSFKSKCSEIEQTNNERYTVVVGKVLSKRIITANY